MLLPRRHTAQPHLRKMLAPDLIRAEETSLSYIDPNFFSHNVQARIIVRNGATKIDVAGSNDCTDWIMDCEAVLVPRTDQGSLFKGFATMGDESRTAFMEFIKSFPAPYDFGGHSAGCAVALQWASWMDDAGLKPRFVQLLAAPMLYDTEGAAIYRARNIPTLRIAMPHDPIPTLPGASRGGCYESDTLVLDTDGNTYDTQQVDSEMNMIGLIAQAKMWHPDGNYLRGIRCYLKAG